MGFFDKLLSGASSMLGIGKSGGIGGLLNKAKSFIGKGMHFLNSKTGKGLTSALGSVLPGVGDVLGSVKKYGNIANNVLNAGGAERAGERYIKASPLLSQIDRWDSRRMPTIEKTRRRPDDDGSDMGLQGLFN
jgi:hypothetical protein